MNLRETKINTIIVYNKILNKYLYLSKYKKILSIIKLNKKIDTYIDLSIIQLIYKI